MPFDASIRDIEQYQKIIGSGSVHMINAGRNVHKGLALVESQDRNAFFNRKVFGWLKGFKLVEMMPGGPIITERGAEGLEYLNLGYCWDVGLGYPNVSYTFGYYNRHLREGKKQGLHYDKIQGFSQRFLEHYQSHKDEIDEIIALKIITR